MKWQDYRKLALSIDLPGEEETTSWGQPCLKAHGKLWAWWSPSEDAPVFKMSKEEREFLIETAGDVFFVTDHYRAHNLVLVRPEKLEAEWAKMHLF